MLRELTVERDVPVIDRATQKPRGVAIGDRVMVEAEDGTTIRGTVTGVSPGRVGVRDDAGNLWSCHAASVMRLAGGAA